MVESRQSPSSYSEMGRMGGKKGGEKVKERYGPEFYSRIGHKGGEARKRQLEGGD